MHAGVRQRLRQRFIGLGQVHVLADHADAHRLLGMIEAVHHPIPFGEIRFRHIEMELTHHQLVELLGMEQTRDAVDVVGVDGGDDRLLRHIGEERNLAPLLVRQQLLGATQQDIGLDADGAQFLDRVLGRLGLDLTGGADVRHQGQMHEQRILRPLLDPHLADRLQERQRLDVAHGAADLDHGDVGPLGAEPDAGLDLVGDVRDDLHRAAQIVAATFLADHALVDLAGGEVVVPTHTCTQEALIVAQVQVGLGAVVGDIDLAVLEGTHGARIDVDVGIELDHGDAQAARLQQRRQRGR